MDKWAVRFKDKPFKASRYHTNRACGNLVFTGAQESRFDDREVVQVSDEVVEFLGLAECQNCVVTRLKPTARTVIYNLINEYPLTRLHGREIERLVDGIISALEENGYRIRLENKSAGIRMEEA